MGGGVLDTAYNRDAELPAPPSATSTHGCMVACLGQSDQRWGEAFLDLADLKGHPPTHAPTQPPPPPTRAPTRAHIHADAPALSCPKLPAGHALMAFTSPRATPAVFPAPGRTDKMSEICFTRPCGLMDKALVFGTKDCRFESCQGHCLSDRLVNCMGVSSPIVAGLPPAPPATTASPTSAHRMLSSVHRGLVTCLPLPGPCLSFGQARATVSAVACGAQKVAGREETGQRDRKTSCKTLRLFCTTLTILQIVPSTATCMLVVRNLPPKRARTLV